MGTLRKNITTTIIPGDPSVASVEGSPYIPAHYETTITPGYWRYNDGLAEIYTIRRPCGTGPQVNEVGRSQCFTTEYGSEVDIAILTQSVDSLGSKVWVPEVKTTVYIPAVPAVQGTEGITATPAQIMRSLNSGWNSWSHSSNQIAVGDHLSFSVAEGVKSIIVGVGAKSEVSTRSINSLKHAIISDVSGLKVIENGTVKTTLRNKYVAVTDMRIYRRPDNAIVYFIITATENIIYTSEATPAHRALPLFVNAHIYNGGDTLTATAINTGEIKYGAA